MLVFLYMAALFAVMSPGVLARFPKNCSKLIVAATHGVAFVLVFWFTHKFVMRLGRRMGYEGFQTASTMPPPPMGGSMPPPPMSGSMPPPPMDSAAGSMPIPVPALQSINAGTKVAAMNVMISTGSGMAQSPCAFGNDCASGMCMGSKCM
jgi:hypothetical protein